MAELDIVSSIMEAVYDVLTNQRSEPESAKYNPMGVRFISWDNVDSAMKQVVISILGSRLDRPASEDRWATWRPTVAICQHEDLLIDRLELLCDKSSEKLAEEVTTDIHCVSPETEVRLHTLEFRDAWDLEEVYGALHAFAREYPFQPDRETYLVNITTGTHVQQICLYLLAESRHIPAKLLQASPPRRKQQSASGTYRIIDLDLSRYDNLAARFALEQQESLSFLKSGIETRNVKFNELIERIEQVAIHSSAPMLITGPTGAGKSQLARRVYELKQQRRQLIGAFVEVNCATLRGDQAMSALFGHTRGAFTGATGAREGLLRAAHDGLLFLDEIGELGLDEQAMLLRATEEKRFLPVGADREVTSSFQLIAGTNRDLQQEVRAGNFREDLLARINLWTFCLPGLAERREDISPNLDYELTQFSSRTGQVVRMNKEAREAFVRFAESDAALWRANFRDLNAAVTRMATLAAGGRITTELVAEEIERLRTSWTSSLAGRDLECLPDFLDANSLDRFDLAQLREVVTICRESKTLSDAGRKLFAVSRQAKVKHNDADRLRKYLARFGLDWETASAP
jgi:transcriptional regulatory protein RtcR